jgi:hypothetical protein
LLPQGQACSLPPAAQNAAMPDQPDCQTKKDYRDRYEELTGNVRLL